MFVEDAPEIRKILIRLGRLESENKRLQKEIDDLRFHIGLTFIFLTVALGLIIVTFVPI